MKLKDNILFLSCEWVYNKKNIVEEKKNATT